MHSNGDNLIVQWNIRGFRKNYAELITLLKEHNPIVICLQETELGTMTPKAPRGYTAHYKSYPHGRPGTGLATLVHQSVACTQIPLRTNLQAQAFRIGLKRPITYCNLYVSPREALTENIFTDLHRQLPEPLLIVGDFNAHSPLWENELINNSVNPRGKTLEAFIVSNDITLLNTGKATHFYLRTASHSAPDISLCSSVLYPDLAWNALDDLMGSDHYPIVISSLTRENVTRDPRYCSRRADWTRFTAMTVMQQMDINLPCDELVTQLHAHIINIADRTIPKTSGNFNKTRVPWWTNECSTTTQLRKQALRRYKRTRSQVDLITLKRQTAIARRTKLLARRESWRQYISSINRSTPMSKVWSRIRKMSGKYCSHPPPTLNIGGNSSSDPIEVAEHLANHYATVSASRSYNQVFYDIKQRAEQHPLDFSTEQLLSYNEPISALEVAGAIKSAKPTSPGEDMVSYEMLRHLHPSAFAALLSLFNKIWLNACYPTQWRDAVVLSFLKPGKPADSVSSYRPIALTSCIAKVLEKVVAARMMRHMEAHTMLSPLQFGFRKMLSSQDAVLRVSRDIQESLARKEHTVCVLFDLTKAYDTTWLYGILREIHRLGFRGPMAYFVRNFLSDRKFRTKIGNSLSLEHTQEEGVPQGSVLSCLLFAIAINGLPSVVPPAVKSSLYVDDYMIYASSTKIQELQRQLQSAINQVTAWTNTHGYKISTDKTVAIHIHRSRSYNEPDLRLYGSMIPFKETVKFLGMHFDHRWKWDVHIKRLKTTCIGRLSILRVLSHSNWGADRMTLLRLYRALIRSKLEYGAVVYGCASDTILDKLEPVHNSALRICTGAFRSSPIVSLLAECGEPSLKQRRQQLSLQYYSHVLARPTSPTCQSMRRVPIDQSLPTTFAYNVHSLLTELRLPPFAVIPFSRQSIPIWRLPEDIICPRFTCITKSNIAPQALKQLYDAHVDENHRGDLAVYTDGSKDNELVGSAAIFPNRTISRKLPSACSIFTAEIVAIIEALDHVDSLQFNNITIYSDSLSVLQALKTFDSNHPLILKVLQWLTRLHARHKRVRLCWTPSHISVPGNCRADTEARSVAQSNIQPQPIDIPHSDYFPTIRKKLHTLWETKWQNIPQTNKLRVLKESIKPWTSSYNSTRRTEVTLCRLRIGHTRLTHRFLMENAHPPYCQDCLVPLTVCHLLAECPNWQDARYRYFPEARNRNAEDTLRLMLTEKRNTIFNITLLLNYLNDTQILTEI